MKAVIRYAVKLSHKYFILDEAIKVINYYVITRLQNADWDFIRILSLITTNYNKIIYTQKTDLAQISDYSDTQLANLNLYYLFSNLINYATAQLIISYDSISVSPAVISELS